MTTNFTIPATLRLRPLCKLPLSEDLQAKLQELGLRRLGDLSRVDREDFRRLSPKSPAWALELGREIRKLESPGTSSRGQVVRRPRSLEHGKATERFASPPEEFIHIPLKMAGIAINRLTLSARLDKALREHGVETLGQLEGKSVEEFRAGWNFGLRTENELLDLVRTAQTGVSGPTLDCGSKAGLLLDRTLFEIPAHSRDVAVSTLDLSTRLAGALERLQIRRLGDLTGCEPDTFLSHANFGRVSLAELQDLVRRVQAGELNPDAAELDALRPVDLVPFLDGLVAGLKKRDGTIVRRRLGALGGPGETLHQVGISLGLTRERIRQVVGKCVRSLRKQGGPKLARLISRIAAACAQNVCPLTPALVQAWLERGRCQGQSDITFYVRLLAALAPELPVWLDAPWEGAPNGELGEAVCMALTARLSKGPRRLPLKQGYFSLRRQPRFKNLTPLAFLEAVRRSPVLSVTCARPESPVLRLRRS